ncbi:MAG: HAD family hydrolase [Thermoplasmata archaeon]
MAEIEFNKLNLIVLDYDRTVTDSSLNFDKRIVAPITKLRESGVKVALVTGREWDSISSLKDWFDAIAFENGALVYAKNKKYKYYAEKNDEIKELLIGQGIKYTAGEVIFSISLQDFNRHRQLFEKFNNVEYIKNIGSVMILPNGINKGSAVQKILKLLNIQENYSLAIGDGENDVEMFNAVRYRVSIENSVKELKDISDLCIHKEASEGVLEFLNIIIYERGENK